MKRKTTIGIICVFTLVLIVLLHYCSKPQPPELANPLAPNNPETSGDPFSLKVSIGNGGESGFYTVYHGL